MGDRHSTSGWYGSLLGLTPLLILQLTSPAPVAAIQAPVQSLVAAYDRLAALPLWPGFAPAGIPLAISDGDSTWLVRHPSPPAEFRAVPGWPAGRVMPGQHPAVRANTHVDLGGVPTATMLLNTGAAPDWTRLAGTLIHEAFHVYQAREHRGWIGNEVEFFTYPVQDTTLQRLQRLETEAWRRATVPGGSPGCWAREALRFRRARFARLAPGAIAYERGNELNEGLATWVEVKATRAPVASLIPSDGYAPDGVRLRAYPVGAVQAWLLERQSPRWPTRLMLDTLPSLDAHLERALPDERCRARFSTAETDSVAALAGHDVALLLATRDSAHRAFSDHPGWRVTILAGEGSPLWPQGFDPWNLVPVDGQVTLHRRWLKLGNDAGQVEVLDRSALTIGRGEHPLFTGVGRLEVTGLETIPTILSDSAGTSIKAPGLSGRFTRAVVDTLSSEVTIRLP